MKRVSELFAKRFGDATGNHLLVTHTGISCCHIKHGWKMDGHFVRNGIPILSRLTEPTIRPVTDTTKAVSFSLEDWWTSLTMPQLIAKAVLLHQEVTRASIGMLKSAHSVSTKAKKYANGVGLHFPRINPPLKLAEVADSSCEAKHTAYAQEAVMILLIPDGHIQLVSADSPHYQQLVSGERAVSGLCHILAHRAYEAKRVSTASEQQRLLHPRWAKN